MTPDNLDAVAGRWVSSNNPVSTHTKDLLVLADNTGELLRLGGYGPSLCWGGDYGEGMVSHYDPGTRQ